MKICFPVQDIKGMDSTLDMNIMTAKCFLIVDSMSAEIKTVPRGALNPLASLEKETFDILVVNSIGRVAVEMLREKRKKVYKCHGMTVAKNVEMAKKRALTEITPDQCT